MFILIHQNRAESFPTPNPPLSLSLSVSVCSNRIIRTKYLADYRAVLCSRCAKISSHSAVRSQLALTPEEFSQPDPGVHGAYVMPLSTPALNVSGVLL